VDCSWNTLGLVNLGLFSARRSFLTVRTDPI